MHEYESRYGLVGRYDPAYKPRRLIASCPPGHVPAWMRRQRDHALEDPPQPHHRKRRTH